MLNGLLGANTTQPGAAAAGSSTIDQLAKLKELHHSGVLDDAQFEASRAKLTAQL